MIASSRPPGWARHLCEVAVGPFDSAHRDLHPAALAIAELERIGEYVPEPPAEFQRSAE